MTHFLTSLNFFAFNAETKLSILASPKVARIPVSILPVDAYLCNSFKVRLKSGKYLLTTSARTFSEKVTSSAVRIPLHLAKNDAASCCFILPRTLKSITVVLLCRGSMILFLKLQVNINLQFFWNSSIDARSKSCTSGVVLSASSMIRTLCFAPAVSDTVAAKFFAWFLTVSRNLPSSDPLMT